MSIGLVAHHLRPGRGRHLQLVQQRSRLAAGRSPASSSWPPSSFHALRVKHPLLDLRLYRSWHFSAASIVMFALGAAVFGAMILMPLYWQDLRGYSVIDTGLLTGPQGLGMAITMPLAARLTDRYGGGRVALVGVLVTAVMTIPFGLIGAHTSVACLCVAMVLRGAGMGASFMPAMTAAFAALDRSQVSHATPQLNVLNRVGGSIGTTILAVVLADALRDAHSTAAAAHAYGIAFWWSVGMATAGRHPVRRPHARRVQRPQVARAAGGLDDPDRARAASRGAVAEALRLSTPRRAAPRETAAAHGAAGDLAHDRLHAGQANSAWRSSGRWSRCAGCAGARRTDRARSATPSTDCCSQLAGMCERSARDLAEQPTSRRRRSPRCSNISRPPGLTRVSLEQDRRVVLIGPYRSRRCGRRRAPRPDGPLWRRGARGVLR